jgi:hypothetical protein
MEPVSSLEEQKLPWRQFIDAVHQEGLLGRACTCSSSSPDQVNSIDLARPMVSNMECSRKDAIANRSLKIASINEHVIGGLFNHDYAELPDYFSSRPYLPPHCDRIMGSYISSPDVSSLEKSLEHIVLVVSNDLDEELVHKLVDILADNQHARHIFTRFIGFDLVTSKAFIERLWFPAVQHGNYALVQILIEAGVDVNIRGGSKARVSSLTDVPSSSLPAITALQCTIEKGYWEITDLLLKHNANDWHAKLLHVSSATSEGITTNYFKICTLVDLAVKMDDSRLLQQLLDLELSIFGQHQSASNYTIRLATALGHVHLIAMITDSRPGLWIPSQLFRPLWVPALQPLPTLLDTAEALLSNMDHTPSIKAASEARILSFVLDIKRRGLTKPMKPRHRAAAQSYTVKDVTELPPNLPPLHIAICGYGIQLMALMLEHGADSKQFCGAYPIQLATNSKSLKMVNTLISYGCEVDAISTDDWTSTDRKFPLLRSPREPAIFEAWRTCQFDIIQSLLDAGAKFSEHNQTTVHPENLNSGYFACTAPNLKEDEGIQSNNYLDH